MFLSVAFSQENAYTSFDVSLNNSIRLNRFLINPAFSFARENAPSINIVNKRQWVKFKDAPVLYLLNYQGRISNESRFGIGAYSQSIGLFKNNGGILNYAINVPLENESNLTFGINTYISSTNFDVSRAITETTEPLLQNQNAVTIISVKPGINLNFNNFDVGIAANNILSYNLTESQTSQENKSSFYSGHLMYTKELSSYYNLLDGSNFSTMLQVQNGNGATGIAGSFLIDQKELGWAEVGYNTLYGAKAGIGVSISEKFLIGYAYNIAINNSLFFGSSHEFSLSYKFKEYDDSFNFRKRAQALRDKNAKKKKPANATFNQLEEERVAKAKVDRERLAKEKAENDRLAQAEKERLAALALAEKEKLAREQAEKDRLTALSQAEKDRLAKEKAEKEKVTAVSQAEQERLAREQAEKDRLAALAQAQKDRLAREKAEKDRLAREASKTQAEKDRLAKEQADKDRLAKEAAAQAEKDRLAREAAKTQAEKDRLAKEQADRDRLAKETAAQAEKDRLAREAAKTQAEKDRLVKEQAERDRIAKEATAQAEKERLAREAASQIEKDRLAREQAEKDRLAREAAVQVEKDRLAREAATKTEKDRLAREQAEKDRLAREAAAQVEKERLAREAATKAEKDRLAREQAEQDRLAKEATAKAEKERLAREAGAQAEKDRLAREQAEKERLAKEAAAKAEKERLAKEAGAQAEKDRLAKEQAEKERLAKEAAAKAEKERLAKEAGAQAEKDRLAKEAAAKAERDRLAKEANAKLSVEDKITSIESKLKLSNKVLDDYKTDIAERTKNSEKLIKRLDSIVNERDLDLKAYIAEDDPNYKGAPRKFVSTTQQNAQLNSLKSEISSNKKVFDDLIFDFENANRARLAELKASGASEEDARLLNEYYQKVIDDLKNKKQKYIELEKAADQRILKINADKEEERQKRIKKAEYSSEQQRILDDQKNLDNIKSTTSSGQNPQGQAVSGNLFDDEPITNDISIVKKMNNVASGYYMVLGKFKDTKQRDAFIKQVVSEGGTSVNQFYNIYDATYYVYLGKFEELTPATNELNKRGTKTYNKKMRIVSVE